MGLLGKGDWVRGEAEILEEKVIKDPSPKSGGPDTPDENWEDLKKTIDYRLRISAGTRAPYEVEERLKKPNKVSTKDGKIPVLVHPDKPEKLKPLWKELPRSSDVGIGMAKEKLAGLGDQMAQAQQMMAEAAGGGGGGDPMAMAHDVLAQQYKLAKGPQKEMLAQQMRAMGMDPPEEG